MFIWRKPKAEVSCFLIGPRADMSIALGRLRSVSVDVSIALEKLMFTWGETKSRSVVFLIGPRADMGIALVRARSVGVDVSISYGGNLKQK